MFVRWTEKERELVSVCVSQCVCVSRGSILYTIVLECVRERERECVCVCRGTGSRNRVEERG